MSLTNPTTAAAATQLRGPLLRPFSLIGTFDGPDGAFVLLKTQNGAIETLRADTPTGDRRLLSIGDGWAMIAEGATIHRLTLL